MTTTQDIENQAGSSRGYQVGYRPNGPMKAVCNASGKNIDNVKNWSDAMNIHWMTRQELTQAIPPAYTQYIGECFTTWCKKSNFRLFGGDNW